MGHYVLGNHTFTSKKAIKDHCIKIKEVPDTEYFPGSEEFAFILDLIKQGHLNAEEKIGAGVVCFYVAVNDLGITRIEIERKDGTCIDFSYINCKNNLKKSRDAALLSRIRGKRIAAYRDAVFDQTYQYRCSQKLGFNTWKCAECQATTSELVYHVDHEPDFAILVMEFEKTWGGDLPLEFADAEEHDYRQSVHCFCPADAEFAKLWAAYHRKYATLQMLCAPCNLRKSRQPYISKM